MNRYRRPSFLSAESLTDEHERVEPDPRWTPYRGQSTVWTKIKAALAAFWTWTKDVAFPGLVALLVRGLALAWALLVAVYGVFRDQLDATPAPKGLADRSDIKRSAAMAATSTSIFSLVMILLIVAMHGAYALVSFLPLGIPGDIALFVIHFFLTLAVRVNNGDDPLATS